MRHFVLLSSILAFLVTNSDAAIYHVKKTGSDSHTCTQAQNAATPKLTISSAFACIGRAPGAGAGHTVRVYAGTYAESLNNNMPGGSSETARFVFEGNPGDTRNHKPTGRRAGIYWAGEKHKYITVAILLLTALTREGYGIFGDKGIHHIRIQDVESENWTEQGIYMRGSFHHLISVHVHHNGGANCTHSSSTIVMGFISWRMTVWLNTVYFTIIRVGYACLYEQWEHGEKYSAVQCRSQQSCWIFTQRFQQHYV